MLSTDYLELEATDGDRVFCVGYLRSMARRISKMDIEGEFVKHFKRHPAVIKMENYEKSDNFRKIGKYKNSKNCKRATEISEKSVRGTVSFFISKNLEDFF